MKKLILIAALTLSTAVKADTDTCEEIENFARTIMSNRQSDVSLVSMIKVVKDNKLGKKMVIDAYESPMFNGKAYKDKTINEFANKWYMTCIKTIK